MKRKITEIIIQVFTNVLPILCIIVGLVNCVYKLNIDVIVAFLDALKGVLSACCFFGFGIILNAAYIYLLKHSSDS